jgi:hypothetical protein
MFQKKEKGSYLSTLARPLGALVTTLHFGAIHGLSRHWFSMMMPYAKMRIRAQNPVSTFDALPLVHPSFAMMQTHPCDTHKL